MGYEVLLYVRKNLTKFLLLFYLLPFTGCIVYEGNIPEVVKEAFAKKYPGEENVDWQFDKNGNFEAKFKERGTHYRADFTPAGKWIETETNIKKKDLPKAVKKAIKEDYDNFKIVEIEKVESSKKGIFYDVEFKMKGTKKDIEFNADGQRIN